MTDKRLAIDIDSIVEDIDHLSPSSINRYLQCGLKFLFSQIDHLEKLRTISDPLAIGSAYHAGLEEHYKGGYFASGVQKKLVEIQKEHPTYTPPDNAIEICTKMFTKYQGSIVVDFKPKLVEKRLEHSITHRGNTTKVPIHGIIDLVLADNTICDHKTTTKNISTNHIPPQYVRQGNIYALLFREAYGKLPSACFLGISNRRSGSWKRVDIPITSGSLNKTFDEVMDVCESIFEKKEFPHKPSCYWCDYKSVCPYKM